MKIKSNLLLLLMISLVGCSKSNSSSIIGESSSSVFDPWGGANTSEVSSTVTSSSSSLTSSESSVTSSSEVSSSEKESSSTNNVESSTESSSSEEELVQGQYNPPETGYALLISASSGVDYYIPLVAIPEKDGVGRDQFFGDNIILNKGDIFKMYNCDEAVSWTNITIEEYGQYANFSKTNNGISVLVSGTYDIYAKMMFENDTMYIGNQDGI